jgi:hypothetical protein
VLSPPSISMACKFLCASFTSSARLSAAPGGRNARL